MVEEVALRLGFDTAPAKAGETEFKRSAEEIKKKAAEIEAATKKASAENAKGFDRMREQANQTAKGFDKMRKSANDNADAFTRQTREARRALTPMGRLERATRGLGRGFAAVRDRTVEFSNTLDRRFGRSLRRARRGLAGLTAGFAALARGIPGGAGLAAGGGILAALGGGAGIGLQQFASIESGLVDVQKTTDLTNAELEELRENVFDISKTIPVATKEILGFAAAAGQLGVRGVDNITKFSDVLAKLSITSDVQGEEGARQLARILTVTQTDIGEVDRFASALTALGNTAAATEQEILDVSTRIAQAVAQFGGAFDARDVLALATTLREVGVEAELAGSFSVRVFDAIGEGAFFASKEGELLRQTIGKSAEELQRLLAQNPKEAFDAFIEGFAALNQSQATDVLNRLGLDGVRVAPIINTLAQNLEVSAKNASLAADEYARNAATTEEAAKQAETFSGSMTTLGNEIKNATSSIGRGLAPTIVSITEGFARWANEMERTGNFESIGRAIGATLDVIRIALFPVIKAFQLLLFIFAKLGDLADFVGRQFDRVGEALNAITIPDWMDRVLQKLGLISSEADRASESFERVAEAGSEFSAGNASEFDPDVLPDIKNAPFTPSPLINPDASSSGSGDDIKDTIDELARSRDALRRIVEAEANGLTKLSAELERQVAVEETIVQLGLKEGDVRAQRIRDLSKEITLLEQRRAVNAEFNNQEQQISAQQSVNEALRRGGISAEEAADKLEFLSFAAQNNVTVTAEMEQRWRDNAAALREANREFDTLSETANLKRSTDALRGFSIQISGSGRTSKELRRELELLNEATSQGIDTTTDYGRAWLQAQRDHQAATDSIEKGIERIEKQEQVVRDFNETLRSEFKSSFADVIKGTKSLTDALNEFADRLTDFLLDLALNDLLGGGPGGFNDLFTSVVGNPSIFGTGSAGTASNDNRPGSSPIVSEAILASGTTVANQFSNVFIEDGGGWVEQAGGVFENQGGSFLDSLGSVFSSGLDGIGSLFEGIGGLFSGGGGGGGLFGGIGSIFSSIFGSIFHDGGTVGGPAPQRAVPAATFINAPRLHQGTVPGLRADEFPAILQRGEEVLSRTQAAGIRSGGGAPGPMVINVNFPNARNTDEARQAGNDIAAQAGAAARRGMRRAGGLG